MGEFLTFISFTFWQGDIDRQSVFGNAKGQAYQCAAKSKDRIDSTIKAIDYYDCVKAFQANKSFRLTEAYNYRIGKQNLVTYPKNAK